MAATQMFTAERSLAPGTAVASSAPNPVSIAVNPSMSEQAVVGKVRELFARARNERKPVINQWQRNFKIMRNRTWGSNRLSWMPQPEVPECRSTVASCVAWLTDNRPEFDLGAVAAPYSEYSGFFNRLGEDMKVAIDASWQTYGYESEVETTCWDVYQYGVGIFKTTWDASLTEGMGDVSVRRVDPWTWYPDPNATTTRDMNYCIEARTISLQELDRRFPGTAAKFSVQGYTETVDQQPDIRRGGVSRMPMANPGAIAPATSARYGLPGQGREHVSRDDTGVTLLECWLREHSYVPAQDDRPPKVYEVWRCICVAGPHVLMNKRADEMYPFTTHPYDVYNAERTGEMYPQAMVELLTSSQISINHALASIEQMVDIAGNPPFKESSRSGLQRQKINPSQPGARVTVAAGDTDSGWMTPPSNNMANLQLVEFHINRMEHTAGLSAISQGMVGGRLAADVYDSAQEAGFVRIRLAQRNLEFALRQVGQKMAGFIAEFYTEPRFLELVGPDGAQSFKALQGRHFYVPGKNGEVPLRFKVGVQAGSMLPTSRNARVAEVDTLFAMGAVDRPVVLEAHKIPNRQAIMERMAEMDAKGMTQAPGARQRARH